MKKLICVFGILLFFGCASKKETKDTSIVTNIKRTIDENTLSITEKLIVNDFLDFELKKDKYKNYKNFQPLLIQEAISKLSSLTIYRYCYEERNLKIRSASNKDWIIDSIEIKNIQDTLRDKKYLWKSEDINAIKVNTIGVDIINKSTKSYKEYEKYNNNLIFYMSVPLVFKQNYAFMSYRCMDVIAGYSTIDMFTVLLKKKEKGKWEVDSYYYDPNSSW